MRGKRYERDELVKAILCVQRYKSLRVWEYCKIFLSIVGILGFCNFMIFPSRGNTLILCFQNSIRFSLICGCKHDWPNHVKTRAPLC